MNLFKTITLAGLLSVGAVYGEDKSKDLHLSSPNGLWEAVAERQYHKDGTFQGYLFKIIDLKTHQLVYDDTKVKWSDDDGLAQSTSFYWSPDDRYLAQHNYVGRIAQAVFVSKPSVGTNGHYFFFTSLDLEDFFPKESCHGMFCYDLDEKPWLNNTDLAINVSYRSTEDNPSPYPDKTSQVIVRFHNNTWKVIKIGKPQ